MSVKPIHSLLNASSNVSLAKMVNFLNEAVLVFSSTGSIEIINSIAANLLGGSRPALLGENILVFISEQNAALNQQIIQTLNSQSDDVINTYPQEIKLVRKDKRLVDVDISISHFVFDNNADSPLYFCILRDLSSHKAEHSILHQRAISDHLTGLYNRQHFDALLDRHWKLAESDTQPFSLLLIDVDHFKAVNDTYGHLIGDKCLKQIADTISLSLPHRDAAAARFGGDEFAVLLPDCSASACRLLAMRLKRHISQLRFNDGLSRSQSIITVSIGGVSTDSGLFHCRDSFLQAADNLLYQAKNQGRNQICC